MHDDPSAALPAATQPRPDDGGTLLESFEHLSEYYSAPAAPPPVPPRPVADHHTAYESDHHTAYEPVHETAYEPLPPAALPQPPGFVPAPSGTLPPPRAVATEEGFRPKLRPPVPRLTILDDGETDHGETIRLREAAAVIGRSEGSILLPHDQRISARHAEIVREGAAEASQWVLRDLGSKTGTFVRCSRTDLRPDRLIVLGSRRFRFQWPGPQGQPADAGTLLMDTRHLHQQAAPTLVETTNVDPAQRLVIPLTKELLTLGRPGCGNDIGLDDPLIAALHAQIVRRPDGVWRIESKPTRNGVWVQINSIRLSASCRFQCGEQRFLFVV